ncbi:MAG: cysteine protease [Rhodocyclales bacterium]|nr:cysteine protease [Rhodocyclales bacterium]
MIFFNPSGAPELACEQCGCRWFDRMSNTCYECGAEVTPQMQAEFEQALKDFQTKKQSGEKA